MLLRKILIVLLPILGFLLVNVILAGTIQDNFVFPARYKHNIFPEDNEFFDYVVVGHSHARDSFDFDLTTQNGINLALSAQTIEWSDKMLQQYEGHFNDETIIIVEISYSSFCTDIQKPLVRYIPLGFRYNEIGLEIEEYIIEKFFPFVGFNGAWDFFLNGQTHFADIQLEYNTEEELNANAMAYFESNFIYSSCSQENIDKNYTDLLKLIEHQKNRGREVLLYSAPIYHKVSNNFSNNIVKVEISNKLINQISEIYELEYYNLYNINSISSDFENFRNANHLNSKGAKLFMEFFFELIN